MSDTPNPITHHEVIAAAEALQAAKAKVTILAVREKLGRGSFTTVKKFLERWQSSHESLQPPSPVPPQLASLWIEARRAADANLATERESLSALTIELDTRLKTMEAARVEAENARRFAETRLADKAAELARTQAMLEDLQRQRDRIASKLEGSETALAQERASWATLWRETHEQFVLVKEAQISLLNQGAALAETVQISTITLARELVEFRVGETQSRKLSAEKLSTQMVTLLEPVSGIAARLTEVDRQMRKLNRKPATKGLRIRGRDA